MVISTNLRSVKLVSTRPRPYYSVETSKNEDLSLCSHCGRQMTCKTLRKLSGYKETSPVRRCDIYMPPLVFRNQRGTEGQFNTFRLGGAWSRRLFPGAEVGLLDASGALFGTAHVVAIYYGAIEDMAQMFGADNHMMIGKEVTLPGDMLKVLRQSYGNMIYKAHDTATVIYMSRD